MAAGSLETRMVDLTNKLAEPESQRSEISLATFKRNHYFRGPRFSLRTLAILVSLVCAYFGAWEATKRNGVRDVVTQFTTGMNNAHLSWHQRYLVSGAKVKVPFIVVIDPNGMSPVTYLWFFGYAVRLSPTFPFQL